MIGWINGDLKPVNEMSLPVLDRGLQYGEGLYETMLVHQGQIPFLDRHCARLRSSCQRLDLPYPGDQKIAQITTETILENASSQSGRKADDRFVLKLLLTGGTGTGLYRKTSPEPHLILLPRPFPDKIADWKDKGGVARFVPARGNTGSDLGQVKSTSRLDETLALEHVHQQDGEFREALFVDDKHRLLQGARSNVFVSIDGTWYTPSVSVGVLPGIARELLLERSNNGNVEEQNLFTEDLLKADCVAATNAVTGPVQLRKIIAPSLLSFDRSPLTYPVQKSIRINEIWTGAIQDHIDTS